MVTIRTLAAGLLAAATAAPGFAIDPKPASSPAPAAARQPAAVAGKAERAGEFRFDFSYNRPLPYPAPVATPVVVAPAPAVYPPPQRPFRLGVTTYRGWGGGLVVASVVPYSPAADIGLEPGDVLVTANGRYLNSHYDLAAALTFAERRGGHLCLVVRSVRDGFYYQLDADVVPDVVIQGAPPVVIHGVPVVPGVPRPAAERAKAAPAAEGATRGPQSAPAGEAKFGVKNVIRKQVAAPEMKK